MADRVIIARRAVSDLPPGSFAAERYDVGLWAAGYEERSSWLVQSRFCPTADRWYRVEFEEHRDALSAPEALRVHLGALAGGKPGKRDHDGHWSSVWRTMLREECARVGRRIDVFVDYSSMPRTVYGPLLIECIAAPRLVRSLTLAYVPGHHGGNVSGSRSLEGLRSLIGTEGRFNTDKLPAFVLGLGFDGILAEALVTLYQVANYCCLVGEPGVTPDAVSRARDANRRLLSRSDLVATASAWSPVDACMQFVRLARWYEGRDVILVPMGPKPHVVGSILASLWKRDLAVRFAQAGRTNPVQVSVSPDAVPFATRVENTTSPSRRDAESQ